MRRQEIVRVRSIATGETLKEFIGVELHMGNQYWTSWCFNKFGGIEKIEKTYSRITYWV